MSAERKPSDHHKVGVEGDPHDAANAERGERVVMLQASEFALYSGAGGQARRLSWIFAPSGADGSSHY
ncbi:MAG: hypothetical protein M3540_07670 [Actinomycetota bacterium]|nr:hypothetical protein [Actinomycetota bacterium]